MNTNLLAVRIATVLLSESPDLDMSGDDAAKLRDAIYDAVEGADAEALYAALPGALDGQDVVHFRRATTEPSPGDIAMFAGDLLHYRVSFGRAF